MKRIDFPAIHLTSRFLLLLLAVIFSAGVGAVNVTTNAEPHGVSPDINREILQAKIEAVKTRQGIDDTLKSKVLAVYQSAQDNLGNTEAFKAQAAFFKQAIKEAPENIKKLQKEIEQAQANQVQANQLQSTPAKQKQEDLSRISTDELDQRLIIEKSKISGLDEQIKRLENELVLQNNRSSLIREEIVTAGQDIETAQLTLAAPSVGSDSKLETEAKQMQLKTLIDARTAELKMLDVEAISNPARVELLKTELQLLNLQKNAVSPVIAMIEDLVTERRQQEAKDVQDALSQAEKELSGKHSVLQTINRENIQYSRDLQTITVKIESYNEQKNRSDSRAGAIENDFKNAEKKISLAGLSPALGKILREQRRNLLVRDQSTPQSDTIQNETAVTSLEQFKVEDNLKRLGNIETALQEVMELKVDKTLAKDQRMMIQAELRVLMVNQKELLNKLSVAYASYLHTLGDYDFARQQMLTQANKFAVYLDERLLWVPSSEPINTNYPVALYRSIRWLLSPSNWQVAIKDSFGLLTHNLFLSFIGLMGLIGLLLSRKPAKLQLALISNKVDKIYTDRFYYTLKALAYTLVLVLPIPLFIAVFGWCLSNTGNPGDFSKALGEGLVGAAAPLFFLQFFYRLFAPAGIARKHFQWQKDTASLLQRQFAWLRFVSVPCAFIINSSAVSKVSIHGDNLGRLALIIGMIAMAFFLSRLLNPACGLLQHVIAANPDRILVKLRYVWYSAAILVPLVIAGFAVAGYYLSALELQQKLIISLRLMFLTIILHEMVFRWLTLVNRQLAIENARQKRKAVALSEKQHAVVGAEDPVLSIDEQLVDIPKINAQTIRLLNVFIGFSLIIGFGVIWKNILPAFSFLDRIVLWQHLVTIDHQERYQPITLTNLMLAGLYIFVAAVSVRNFSGIVELLVFRRLSIEAGSRYAVNQLAKYLLVSIGFICVANELGGSWSQVQWLVAALSVGLGFGLQEIFANLVSGIILLFERPIRVGDTVTISDVTGKVSRIQMRATTLIDWDQKEMIIPNKTFITSQLVNWTLSDSITRIVIPIGIAYGADAELAHKVMMDTVRSTPLILAEPAPSVLCVGFGDSALNFSIRIFVSELANRLPVTHDLHMRLEKALREHDISIPFPQRDIHIHSITQESDTAKTPDLAKLIGAEMRGGGQAA